MIEQALTYIGLALVGIGAFCDIAASIGINRFPNFFVRLHAATVGAIGGAVVPAFGVALIALGSTEFGEYRFFMAGVSFVTGLIIIILGQAGAHALARATLKAKIVSVESMVVNALKGVEESD